MEQIWAEYSSRLSRVSRLRHRCLDIKDESLAAEFERFHNEMQAVDTMILSAIKLSFDQATYIKEKCEILDAFHSMSERSRYFAGSFFLADETRIAVNIQIPPQTIPITAMSLISIICIHVCIYFT